MDDLEREAEEGGAQGVNFIPCLKWVARGVAKAQPTQVGTALFLRRGQALVTALYFPGQAKPI